MEKEIGSLELGTLTDLVVLDRDILTVPQDDLRDARVLTTFRGDKIVHGSLDLFEANSIDDLLGEFSMLLAQIGGLASTRRQVRATGTARRTRL